MGLKKGVQGLKIDMEHQLLHGSKLSKLKLKPRCWLEKKSKTSKWNQFLNF